MDYLQQLRSIGYILDGLSLKIDERNVLVPTEMYDGIESLEHRKMFIGINLIKSDFLKGDNVVFLGESIISFKACSLAELVLQLRTLFELKNQGRVYQNMGDGVSVSYLWRSSDKTENIMFEIEDSKVKY